MLESQLVRKKEREKVRMERRKEGKGKKGRKTTSKYPRLLLRTFVLKN